MLQQLANLFWLRRDFFHQLLISALSQLHLLDLHRNILLQVFHLVFELTNGALEIGDLLIELFLVLLHARLLFDMIFYLLI